MNCKPDESIFFAVEANVESRDKMLRRAEIWYNLQKIEGAIWKRN